MNKGVQEKAPKYVASYAVLEWKIKKIMSGTCSIREPAARDLFLQVLGFYHLLSRWSERGENDIERRKHEVEVIRKKLLRSLIMKLLKLLDRGGAGNYWSGFAQEHKAPWFVRDHLVMLQVNVWYNQKGNARIRKR